MFSLLRIAVTTILYVSVISNTIAQECGGEKLKIPFPRTMFAYNHGPPPAHGTRSSFTDAIGACISIPDFIDRMATYYDVYGFDTEAVRRDPFGYHENENFYLQALNYNRTGTYRVFMESFYDHVEAINAPFNWAAWFMYAKRPVDGPRGRFATGDWAVYGMARTTLNRQPFCMQFNERVPNTHHSVEGIRSPLDFEVYNAQWGKGSVLGLAIFENGRQKNNVPIFFPGA